MLGPNKIIVASCAYLCASPWLAAVLPSAHLEVGAFTIGFGLQKEGPTQLCECNCGTRDCLGESVETDA
eukprot:6441348-Karenia_brevis.AAC.1